MEDVTFINKHIRLMHANWILKLHSKRVRLKSAKFHQLLAETRSQIGQISLRDTIPQSPMILGCRQNLI